MINLLPPERQESYRYGRRNHHLVRWLFGCGLGFIGLLLIAASGAFYIHQQANSYTGSIAAAKTELSAQKQSETNKQASDISNSIKLAVQVLGKEVLFSDLLKQIAAITPGNAALANLNISQVAGAIDITANTANYDAATQLQINLADPNNKIFAKADIVSINCASQAVSDKDNRYPCTAVIRALFAPNNPYLFINQGKAK